MNDHTILLVKESFDLVEPIAPQAAAAFYGNLFEADPSLQQVITGDLVAQGATLVRAVEVAIGKLSHPDTLASALRNVGLGDAGFAVFREHADTVRAALLKTLYQALGVAYTPEVEEAWVEACDLLAGALKRSAAVPA